jgi:hypothetical protein
MVSHIKGRLQTENIQEQGAVINCRRDKLRGQWRELHNEDDLYCSSNNIMMKWRRMKCLEDVACMWEIKNAYTLLVRRSEGKRMLGRTWHKWYVHTTVDLKEYNRRVWTGFA